jgi:polyferredoxin
VDRLLAGGLFHPIRDLVKAMPTFDYGPWESFWIFFYAGFTYLLAGFMREQVCKYMCPYARFQSVMFDADTLIISYDEARGEPRGARKKAWTSRTRPGFLCQLRYLRTGLPGRH